MDVAGNDRHAAARYGHAAGAHNAMGLFIDYEGKDSYESAGPTYNVGCAWDRSVFLLVDGQGNDAYDWSRTSGGGRADHGGWAVFADLDGNDGYRANGVPGGASTKGLGVFFDAVGADNYSNPGASNSTTKTDGSGGMFIDH
jgi:hypothetical protein